MLGKFPVVQHIVFGSLFPCTWGTGGDGAAVDSSRDTAGVAYNTIATAPTVRPGPAMGFIPRAGPLDGPMPGPVGFMAAHSDAAPYFPRAAPSHAFMRP